MVGRLQVASGHTRAEGVGLVAKAAEQGFVLAEALWAWMLDTWSGVAKELHAAAEYYRRAAEKGLERWEYTDALVMVRTEQTVLSGRRLVWNRERQTGAVRSRTEKSLLWEEAKKCCRKARGSSTRSSMSSSSQTTDECPLPGQAASSYQKSIRTRFLVLEFAKSAVVQLASTKGSNSPNLNG
jgi:TPR repeat protein